MNVVTETVAAEPVSGVEIFVPLAKLKKSPRNDPAVLIELMTRVFEAVNGPADRR